MSKKCTGCNQEKDISEFSWKNKAKGKKLARCKVCYSEYRANYYIKNREREIQRTFNRKEMIYNKFLEYMEGKSCCDCGETDLIVLQFDHIDDKTKSVSRLIMDCHSWDSILKEIGKCKIRCANCHTRRTAKQFNWRKLRL